MRPKEIQDAVDYIRHHYHGPAPEVGIVLGTGLGGLANEIEVEREMSYNFIPHFPTSTVESHFGKLIFGRMGGRQVVAMQGRFHFYEGYSMEQITFPIRVMKVLGIKALFISNAAGGLNLTYRRGDLMILDDHINLQPDNPLIGRNVEEFGPRFPDMSRPYDPALIKEALGIAKEEGATAHVGVYVAVTGPNLETRAEYRYLRTIGADVVGMSTVPEVIVASHMGLRTFAISVVTDECDPENLSPINVEEIIATAKATEPVLTRILKRLISQTSL
jgi:purine-nucleoside phosphorylase